MTHHPDHSSVGSQTVVLDVSGVQWASSEHIVETVLSHRAGVLGVEANAVAQTATVIYDPQRTSVSELRSWVLEVVAGAEAVGDGAVGVDGAEG